MSGSRCSNAFVVRVREPEANPIETIRRQDIAAIANSVYKRAPYVAARVGAYLSPFFNWAVVFRFKGPLAKEDKRDRVPAMWRAC